MQLVIETKKFGELTIDVDIPTTLDALIDEYGEAAVYHAATDGRSLSDIISSWVRGNSRETSELSAADIVEQAATMRLTPPVTKGTAKAQRSITELLNASQADLTAAISCMTDEQKAQLAAVLG